MTQQLAILPEFKHSIQKELDNILQFWIDHAVDERNGGFYGEISNDLIINHSAPKGLVLQARILWTYSKAFLTFKADKYLKMAQRAYDYLVEAFWDREFEGYYWHVDEQGKPLNTRKQIYGQAFVVYGLTEYYKVSGDPESLQKAITLYKKIEAVSFDEAHLGYFEAFNREWELEDDLRLSSSDLNEKKSMNTHLHILEAYSNLITVWDDLELKRRQKALIEVMLDHIVDEKQQHFKLFFDEAWTSKSEHISFGHDIEGSWLLVEAAHLLHDDALIKRVNATAITMADAVLQHGVDNDGALWNEAIAGYKIVDDTKDWWPQAEAAVGFLNAYQLSGRQEFLNAAIKSWDFILNYMVDSEHGEWFWQVSMDRKPNYAIAKISPWKCPYHNSRACFELLERLEIL
ncbi:AGE family epimerase/isomerase [Paenibacillus psychroresistens]|uniref:AGE family epimerase/isomerase n=1 Tax=Paenibacillus psychroresistens TaxID=1778678 RepID=UPI001D049F92|nr:AGE family epimerase/isomerase [Paenibacillus psychroresistens]